MKYDDPEFLHKMYSDACTHRDERTRNIRERIARLCGPGYKGHDTEPFSFVNHQYAFLTVLTPRVSSGTPKVSAKTTRGGIYEEVAKAQSFYGSKWARKWLDSRFRARLFLDYAMLWAVARVSYSPSNDDPRDPGRKTIRIECDRVRMDDFFIDPHAECMKEALFMGHVWTRRRSELLARAEREDGWNKEVIRHAPASSGRVSETMEEDSDQERDEVMGIDWWIPGWSQGEDYTADDGFRGTIVSTLAHPDAKYPEFLREPRPFWGPESGPYVFGGHLDIPGTPYPLSPLSASAPFEMALAEAQRVVNTAVRQYKRIVLVPAGTKDNPDLGEAAKAIVFAPDSCIIEIPGMPADATPVVVEIGGVTDQMLRNLSMMREQLQTHSGLDSAQVGDVVGRGTATEHSIANVGAQARMGGIADRFRVLLDEIMEKVLWYSYHADNLVADLGNDAAEEYGMQRPIYDSGEFSAKELGAFDDVVDAQIEVLSIERTTEPLFQSRIQSAVQMALSLAPTARQYPEWDWKAVLDMLGDSLNIPTLSNIFDMDMAMQLMGLQASEPPQPSLRMASDMPVPTGGGVPLPGRSSGSMAAAASGASETGAMVAQAGGSRSRGGV